ncbi:site-specific integrase [Streptomyces sp900105755]|uniref:site-specific integrase n=1 Tax=Streptomyces sp. 900105755 TaxID=3154389 RepID=UPI00331FFFDA
MLYESAARADEMLRLNVEDLYSQDKRGRITAKGGATEWIHWQSGTAQLLPRLIVRRTRGPLFLTNRKAPAGTPTLDVCPETGRARLSYRRAEEIFEENTRLLANPLASSDDIEDLDGWTLHQLRHTALTHDAEDGTSTPMLLTRSRHTSVRSLERYARPSVDAVARHVAGTSSGRGSTLHRGSEIGDRGHVRRSSPRVRLRGVEPAHPGLPCAPRRKLACEAGPAPGPECRGGACSESPVVTDSGSGMP